MSAVQPATPSDAADLAVFARNSFSDTFTHYPPEDLAAFLAQYTAEFFAAIIADPIQRMWIARDRVDIAGYVHAGLCNLPHPEVTPRCGEIKRLYVRRNLQNGGLGTALMNQSLGWLAAPARTLWLGVFSENAGAQRFYERYGFRKAGEYEFIVGAVRDREFILRRA